MIMLCLFLLFALMQSVFCYGTGEVGQVSQTMTMVNNLTWRLDQTNTEMRNNLKATETELKITKINLQNTQNALKVKIEEIANTTKELGINQGISFKVKLIKRPYKASLFEPLKFDDVTLNKGGGYNCNPTSGIFTVPRTGTFLCWANIMTHTDNYFRKRLMEEGKQIVRGYSGNELAHGTAKITYLKTFRKGEHVWFDGDAGTLSIAGDNSSSYGCSLMYL